jgi:type VI protein secretion system component VasF
MTPDQEQDVRQRVDQVQAVLNAIPEAWAPLAREFERIRAEKVDKLITANNEELRGAIKFIDEVLQLPNNLRQELLNLVNSLPKTGEATGN